MSRLGTFLFIVELVMLGFFCLIALVLKDLDSAVRRKEASR